MKKTSALFMEEKSASEKTNIRIAYMQAIDVPQMVEIEEACGLSLWGERGYLKETEREDSLGLIAKIREQAVGFILVRLITPESELLNMAVMPRFQHCGIGKLLLDTVIADLMNREITEMFLEVRKSNETARKFYRKHNFFLIGERENYYSQPSENAVLYKLVWSENDLRRG